jgi:hypothetical protein
LLYNFVALGFTEFGSVRTLSAHCLSILVRYRSEGCDNFCLPKSQTGWQASSGRKHKNIMESIKILPGEVPHVFSGQSRIGIYYEIIFRLSDNAYLNNARTTNVIQKILDQVSQEMERRLTDHQAKRTNFLDRMQQAGCNLGDRKQTLTNIASLMNISIKTLERGLDEHFADVPGKHRDRLRAALEACEKETRGKHFLG